MKSFMFKLKTFFLWIPIVIFHPIYIALSAAFCMIFPVWIVTLPACVLLYGLFYESVYAFLCAVFVLFAFCVIDSHPLFYIPFPIAAFVYMLFKDQQLIFIPIYAMLFFSGLYPFRKSLFKKLKAIFKSYTR